MSVRLVIVAAAAAIAAFVPARFALERGGRVDLPRDSFAQAVASENPVLFDVAKTEGLDPNHPTPDGLTALLIATQRRDRPSVERLLDLGANLEVADPSGLTPLMLAATLGDASLVELFLARGSRVDAADGAGRSALHHAILAKQPEALAVLLQASAQPDGSVAEVANILPLVCETENPALLQLVLERAPANLEWTVHSRRALRLALDTKNEPLTRLLLSKHAVPPSVPGATTPLLAQLLIDGDLEGMKGLLAAGLDPNTVLPLPMEKDFLAALPTHVRGYAKADDGMTVLMVAAGLGKPDFVRALLDAGASRKSQTTKYKMLPLYFAARSGKWKTVQMLLGGGPLPEKLRIEISLRTQKATLYKDGTPIFETQCSTGREGFATPAGEYVVTDKNRDHVSTIYKVAMPYFMRLNCLDFGMHAGAVPRYPASHGCIRLPSEAAKKFFSEIPVGTVVMIN